MSKSYNSPKKEMSNVKFFFIALAVSVVIAIAFAIIISNEDAIPMGLLIAGFVSVYLTLFRILRKSNDPEKRLGFWKYFIVLSIFVAGILSVVVVIISQEENSIPVSMIAGVFISFIIASIRGIKYRSQEKKAKKERERQYQERLQKENQQYADELRRKDRIIDDLRSRNSELQDSQRSSYSSSPSQSSSSQSSTLYYNQYQEAQMDNLREQMRRQEEEDRKKQRLEEWYREYVTIEVEFDYHIKDSEYNQDYWDYRDEEIRVSRREAMALIEAGDSAILGRLGYGNWGLIRNFRYKVPYGLYDRPWNT